MWLSLQCICYFIDAKKKKAFDHNPAHLNSRPSCTPIRSLTSANSRSIEQNIGKVSRIPPKQNLVSTSINRDCGVELKLCTEKMS